MMTIREGKQLMLHTCVLYIKGLESGQIYSSTVIPSLTSHDEGVIHSLLLGTKSK